MKITTGRTADMESDLQYLYDRLRHLLFIYENPESVQGQFGPEETMRILREHLPFFKKKYNLID